MVSGLLLLVTLLSSVESQGGGSANEVVWSGVACPESDFTARLQHYLDLREARAMSRRVEATLLHGDDGMYELTLALEDAGGPRRFVAPACSTVIEAAAFVAATTLSGRVEEGAPARPLEPSESAPTEPAPTSIPHPTAWHRVEARPSPASSGSASVMESEAMSPPGSASDSGSATTGEHASNLGLGHEIGDPPPWPVLPVPRSRYGARGLVALVPQVIGGSLPAVGFVASVEAGVQLRRVRIFAVGGYRAPRDVRASRDPAVGGRFSLWYVGASGCFVPRRWTLEFPACVGLEAGQVLGKGFGFPGAASTSAPWLALPMSASIAWVPRHLGLRVGAAVVPVLVRPAWVIEDLEVVFRPGPVEARGFVGVEARFP